MANFCSKCGSALNPGTKFCPSCGNPTQQPQNTQVQQPQNTQAPVPQYSQQPAQPQYTQPQNDQISRTQYGQPVTQQTGAFSQRPITQQAGGISGQPIRPAQPQYTQPAQPQYAQPAQPQYAQPAQPQYSQQPAQPQYTQPAQPQYTQPAQQAQYPQRRPAGQNSSLQYEKRSVEAGEAGGKRKKKKKKKHGCLVTLLVFILIIAVVFTGFIRPGWMLPIIRGLTPLPDYFKQGSDSVSVVNDNSKTVIGDIEENGYSVEIAEGTFLSGAKVDVRVFSQEEAKGFECDDFTMLGSPVNLSATKYEGSYLGKDVQVRFAIPAKFQKENVQNWYIAYYHAESDEWEYLPYDYIDFRKNEIVFTVPHFSGYVPVEVRREKAVDLYLKQYSMEQATQNRDAEQLQTLLGSDVAQMLKGMGVPKENIADATSCIVGSILDKCKDGLKKDSAGVANNLLNASYKFSQNGDEGPFLEALTNTAAEEVTKFLLESKGFDTSACPYPAKIAAGVISKSGSIVGSIETGDYKQVLKDVLEIGVNMNPTTATINACVQLLQSSANAVYANFKAEEIEKIYQMYKNGTSTFAAENFDDLWDDIDYSFWYGSERAAERLYKEDTIKAYCESRGWSETKYDNLPEAKKKEINGMARRELEQYFRVRLENEKEAERIEQKEREFISDLYGVMDSSAYNEFFGDSDKYDPNLRIKKIYEIRDRLSMLVDESKRKQKFVEYSDLVGEWIYYGANGDSSSLIYAKMLNYLNEKGVLRAGIEVPDLNVPVMDDIVGTWNLTETASNIESPFLEALANAIADIFDTEPDMSSFSSATTTMTMKIIKKTDLSAEVRLIPDEDPDEYMVYTAKYKNGVLKLSFDYAVGEAAEEAKQYGVSAAIEKIEMTFTRHGNQISVTGSGSYHSILASADFTFSGTRTETTK